MEPGLEVRTLEPEYIRMGLHYNRSFGQSKGESDAWSSKDSESRSEMHFERKKSQNRRDRREAA